MPVTRFTNIRLLYRTAAYLGLLVLTLVNHRAFANSPGEIAWVESLYSPVSSPISVSHDRVVLKVRHSNGDSCEGSVLALDKNGQELWRYPVNGFCQDNAGLALSETDYIYVFDSDINTSQCGLVGLNTSGEQQLRKVDSYLCEQGFISTLQNGTVVFATQNDKASEIRQISANGYEHWKVEFDFTIRQLVLSDERKVFILTESGQLLMLDDNGAVQQTFEKSGIGWRSFVLLDSDFLLVTTSDDRVCKIDFDGNEEWCHQSDGLVDSTPVIDGTNNIYVSRISGDMTALDGAGEIIWRYISDGVFAHPPIIGSDSMLYVPLEYGRNAGAVIAIDSEGTELWQIDTDSAVGSVMLDAEGHLYVSTAQGELLSINTSSDGLVASSWPSSRGNALNASRQPSEARPNPLDFDGDFKTDLSIKRQDPLQHIFLYSSTSSIIRTGVGAQPSDVPLSGDYDGDGLADIALYRPSTGTWLIHPSSGGEAYCYTFGADHKEIPTPADFDGDGVTDIAFVRREINQWVILPSSGTNDYILNVFEFEYGDIPIPADYDGDGKADMAVRRPNTGSFIITQSSDQSTISTYFGSDPDDIAVPADYDGDGKADIAIRRPSSGIWSILYSSGKPMDSIFFGSEYDDIPIPSDYDGDGKTDIAVRRLSTRKAYIRQSSPHGKISRIHFGHFESDIPLAAPVSIKLEMAKNPE